MTIKYLPNGDPIGEVSLAFRLGRKDKATGEYLTQWVKASMYGKRAETLAQFLTKGSKHAFHLRDIRVDEWTGKEGETRYSLLADIDDVELGGQKQGSAPVPHSKPAPAGGGFDDLDSIPF
jgi:single-strand DNA-binding protein